MPVTALASPMTHQSRRVRQHRERVSVLIAYKKRASEVTRRTLGTRSWQRTASQLMFASAIGVATLTGGAVGHADPDSSLTPQEQQFVNDVNSVGITSKTGDQPLVSVGRQICSELASGNTREMETQLVYARIAGSTPDQAKAVVDFAIKDLCPAAPPISAGRDQQSAEQAIRDGYTKKLANCYATRNAVPNIQSISWDPPGFSEETGGSGTIHDADPRLGGQFLAMWVVGRWDIQYQWC